MKMKRPNERDEINAVSTEITFTWKFIVGDGVRQGSDVPTAADVQMYGEVVDSDLRTNTHAQISADKVMQ